MTRVAVVQHSPSYLDREATVQRVVEHIDEAAALDAKLVVFPEAFIPGYPAWIWRLRPGSDWSLSEKLHARLLDNAIALETHDLKPLCDVARQRDVTVVCGINERASASSRATLYNTVVTIGSDGNLVSRHRKLMPTNPERMVWGFGDGSGLNLVDTPCGRVGSLICWENYMTLTRFTLYAQGIEVYIAPTYDSDDGGVGTMQHIAREGCGWVVSAGVALRNRDFPGDFPERGTLYPDSEDWINPGDSVVVAPGGEIISGPLHEQRYSVRVAEGCSPNADARYHPICITSSRNVSPTHTGR